MMPRDLQVKYIKSSQRLLSLINDIIRISELDAISTEEIFETVNLYETAEVNGADA